jgi:FixJ family two-component response regulator
MSLGLRTIFISGYPENPVTRNGLRRPGVFYLPKPFSAQSLLRQVKQALATLSTIEGSLRVAGSG